MHSATPRARDGPSESLMQDFAEKALVPKLDSYIYVHFFLTYCSVLDLYVLQWHMEARAFAGIVIIEILVLWKKQTNLLVV